MLKRTITNENSKSNNENSKSKGFLESAQDALIRRFGRPAKQPEPVVFEFTNDKALLHQYYMLRERMYRRMYNTEGYKAEMDVYDKLSHILIARRGDLCIGGCRLLVREPDESWDLPLESDDFKLRNILPNLMLDKYRHAEMSRFTVMEDCGSDTLIYDMSKIIIQKAIEMENHYIFAWSTYTLARNWRMIASHFGLKKTTIYTDLDFPAPPVFDDGLKFYLIGSDLRDFISDKEPEPNTERKSLTPATNNVIRLVSENQEI